MVLSLRGGSSRWAYPNGSWHYEENILARLHIFSWLFSCLFCLRISKILIPRTGASVWIGHQLATGDGYHAVIVNCSHLPVVAGASKDVFLAGQQHRGKGLEAGGWWMPWNYRGTLARAGV